MGRYTRISLLPRCPFKRFRSAKNFLEDGCHYVANQKDVTRGPLNDNEQKYEHEDIDGNESRQTTCFEMTAARFHHRLVEPLGAVYESAED